MTVQDAWDRRKAAQIKLEELEPIIEACLLEGASLNVRMLLQQVLGFFDDDELPEPVKSHLMVTQDMVSFVVFADNGQAELCSAAVELHEETDWYPGIRVMSWDIEQTEYGKDPTITVIARREDLANYKEETE
jgi:hypothetical protein